LKGRFILLFACCLSLLLISSSATMGQTPQSAPAGIATPVSRPPDNPYAKEPYVFEFIQRNLRFEADGKGQMDLTVRARVQSESAVREFGILAYSFASSFENLDMVYARFRKPDGTVIETPSTDVQEVDTAVSREAPMGHTLFAALLQAVGIQAYPVLVSSKFRLDPAVPSAGLFDHVFTAIPRGDSFLFLDTTPEVAPFGLLISTIRDRHALVIPSAAPARLVTTPADPPFPGS
jgi:hypothetical protein